MVNGQLILLQDAQDIIPDPEAPPEHEYSTVVYAFCTREPHSVRRPAKATFRTDSPQKAQEWLAERRRSGYVLWEEIEEQRAFARSARQKADKRITGPHASLWNTEFRNEDWEEAL